MELINPGVRRPELAADVTTYKCPFPGFLGRRRASVPRCLASLGCGTRLHPLEPRPLRPGCATACRAGQANMAAVRRLAMRGLQTALPIAQSSETGKRPLLHLLEFGPAKFRGL
jgi:hypothetical protein